MSTGRKLAIGATALVALLGAVLVGSALLRSDAPSAWLDDEATRIDDRTWTADEPPLVVADRLAAAVPPQSRFVDASGIALRYHHQTLTITNGASEGTSMIYLQRRGSTGRRFVTGYWGGGSRFTPIDGGLSTQRNDGTGTGTGGVGGSPVTSTRRGADFRGGGPGSGK